MTAVDTFTCRVCRNNRSLCICADGPTTTAAAANGDRDDEEPDWIAIDRASALTALTRNVPDTKPRTGLPELVADSSFEPVDLADVLAGNYSQPIPTVLHRDDGQGLFYLGEVNGIHGPSGEGKGWVVLAAVVEQIRRGSTALVVDLEDNAPSIVARMRLLGAADADLAQLLVYVRPAHSFGELEVQRLVDLVEQHRPSLVVVDSLGEAFALDGIDEDRDAEVAPWYRKVARRLAEIGPAVVLVDHTTKANDKSLFPSGLKRKRAAITGASYLVEATTPLVAGQGGRLSICCAKDRHGSYRRGETIAAAVFTPTPTGGLAAHLYPPDDPADAEPKVELAVLAAVKAARDEGVTLTTRALMGVMAIKARDEIKRAAIDLAVSRGLLSETSGPRNSREFTAVEGHEP